MYIPKLYTCLKTYNSSLFYNDLFSGITVGVIALPLAMAFAIASGLPPERGIFTAIVAGFLISALGGSRVQIGGPTGAFVVIVSNIVLEHGYTGLIYSTLLAGGFLIVLGLFRMGSLIKFIPFPVTTGFTTGIAVVIFSTQIKDLFGLSIQEVPSEFIGKWDVYFHSFHTTNIPTILIGLLTIGIILICRKYFPKYPAMLVGMIAATAVSTLLQLDIETIGSRFGELPRTLPSPGLPPIEFSQIKELISPAFTIALLAAIESLLSATVADGMIGGRHRPNAELIGQGVANMASVCFGGIPATGAIARTATNVKSGGKTPVAGIIHSITLALILLCMAPLAKMIPLSVLAGILVVISYNMSEVHHFVGMLKAPRSDVMVLLTTFFLTVLVDLTVAVQVGIVLASLLFIRQMAEVTNVGVISKELMPDQDETSDPKSIEIRDVPEGVEVFEIHGPFFFGAADKFQDTMRLFTTPLTAVILRLRNVTVIDATGIHVLREFHKRCKKEKSLLVLSGVHAQPLKALQKCGLWDEISEDNMCTDIDEALNRVREHMDLTLSKR